MEKQNLENTDAKRNYVVDDAVLTRSKKAFTLAETLIALVVLGIVAAITIPALARNYIENNNRTKIKKAMGAYDSAFNKMIVENGIKGDTDLDIFAPATPQSNCTNTSNYFKIAETLSDDETHTNCRFKTMDGIFFDISNIRKVIVSFREEDLNTATADSNTNRAFYLYGWLDNNGTIRVNDLPAIVSADNRASLQALYDYINGLTKTSMEEVVRPKRLLTLKCRIGTDSDCAKYDYDETGKITDEYGGCHQNGESCIVHKKYVYDNNGNLISKQACSGNYCGYWGTIHYEYDADTGKISREYTYCTSSKSTCKNSNYYDYVYDESTGELIMKKSCKNGNCTSVNKYVYENGVMTKAYVQCSINGDDCAQTQEYEYDKDGEIITTHYYNNNGTTYTYSWKNSY